MFTVSARSQIKSHTQKRFSEHSKAHLIFVFAFILLTLQQKYSEKATCEFVRFKDLRSKN